MRESGRLRAEGFRVASVSSWIPTLGIGLPLLFLAAVTWLAARMAARHTISIGDLVAVYGYVAFLVVPARRVIALLNVGRDTAATPATDDGTGEAVDVGDPASGVEVAAGLFTAVVSARPQEAQAVVERLGRFRPSQAVWGDSRLDSLAPRDFRARILVADNEGDTARCARPLPDG